MPLYTDSNFYYSGGSSQLYSPYYPSSPYSPSTSSAYSPYSSTYNRTIGSSYVVPLITSRSPSAYTTVHSLSPRYQPKLTTITESSPLLSSTRHGLIPLTRIQSPKYTSYSTPSTSTTSVGSKYIPPRPILMNTADIDVSAARYRKRKEAEAQEEAKQKEASKSKSTSQSPSPSGSTKKRASKEKPKETTSTAEENERRAARSTIRRNRPVVRLSMIRTRSKERASDSNEPPEKKFHDLPRAPEPAQESLGWRQRLADDLANIPAFPIKKSPGDLIRERYLIQEVKPVEAPKRDFSKITPAPEPIEPVVVELDPLDHSIRRLSLPKCPTFHDICEDISSDKIDDDLNAGELRRRASLIQEQEQEILNQLQKSASGTFQLIHLERRGSQDSQPDETLVIGGKRKSRKSKKIRHKITAIVDVEDPVNKHMPILVEKDENATTPALKDVKPKPKFTFNVDSVEEHDEVHKIFKLPKKKSVKKTPKPKEASQEKPKTYVSTAEIFTFSQQSIEANQTEEFHETDSKKLDKQAVEKVEPPKALKAKIAPVYAPKPVNAILSDVQQQEKKLKTPSPPRDAKIALKTKITETTPSLLKTSASLELGSKAQSSMAATTLVKSQSLQAELEAVSSEKITPLDQVTKEQSTEQIDTTEAAPSTPTAAVFQSSVSLDIGYSSTPKEVTKQLGKAQSLSTEPSVATPKPIRKAVQKSESGVDFWSQIGTRETVYMTNRKKSLHEIQWQKVEEDDLQTKEELKSDSPPTPAQESKPMILPEEKPQNTAQQTDSSATPTNQTKSTISPEKKTPSITKQKDSSVTTTQQTKSTSSIEKKTPPRPKEEKVPKKLTPEKTSSPSPKSTADAVKTPPKTFAQKDAFQKNSSPKKEVPEKLTPTVEKMTETSTAIKTTIATATTTTTSPKINAGQNAKSPEHQTNSTTVSTNANQQQTSINNAATSAAALQHVTSTSAKFDNQSTVSATTTTPTQATTNKITPQATPSVEKHLQPEATIVNKVTEGSKTEAKRTSDLKSPIDNEKQKLPLGKPKVAPKASAPSTLSTQQTSSTPINADHFIMVPPPAKAPTKPNVATSPKNNKAKKNSSPAKTGSANQQKTKSSAATSDKPKTTTPPTTTTTTSIPAATTTKTTTTNVATPTKPAEIPSAAKTATERGDGIGNANANSNGKESGSNLAKFATVSNLAQCLQDVDADIEDYYPSSAEVSEDDGSLSDISSPDGCENLSASMKKKLKLKKKKERKAEKARFDPQKKIKIDVTNKCYVKEEAPRFPLVATPRPLWRREKIEYPDDDTESESESDTGSTEETTDSEECTTSEEYEDDLGTASGGAASTTKDNVSIIRMSTCSNDSGFEGGTAPSSPKKMLECDVNCHKKCERLTANLCGVNQKLMVEALAHVKRGARETRDSPSTPPSLNPAFKIDTNVEEEDDETSHTYSEFQKSGRFTAPATVIPRFKNYCVDDFHFLAVLGKGSFGKVLLAELRDTTYYYAVKCLKKDVVLEDDDVDSTLIERKVLALGTKHPYLCHLFCTFQTESHLFFVMEYLNGGDLMFHIQESGRFTEERARFYGAEIISGLKFLHKKGIIYRDLKLDNVLLDYEGHVRIADFGMCKLQIYLDKTADSFCGTPDYMAPEIVKGEKYNQNVDWWSFGVLLYEMLIGQSPFSGCDEDELFWSICNEIPWFPVYISAEAMSILKGLLEKDSTKRIGTHYSPAGDVIDHIFFRPIDWGLLEKRELKPPFRPQVKHPLDTQYFDRVFTKERVRLTPIDKDILQSMDQKQFTGFTYTNPHIALD